jgi:hypothetical protein
MLCPKLKLGENERSFAKIFTVVANFQQFSSAPQDFQPSLHVILSSIFGLKLE